LWAARSDGMGKWQHVSSVLTSTSKVWILPWRAQAVAVDRTDRHSFLTVEHSAQERKFPQFPQNIQRTVEGLKLPALTAIHLSPEFPQLELQNA
jgi:hypothetical protein